MNIAIIGVGNVGGTLARKWGSKQHSILLGVRDENHPGAKSLVSEIRAKIASPAQAASQAEVVCLTTPWSNTEAAVKSLGDLSGKVLIDCTNPLKGDLSGLTHGFDTSGGEMVAQWAPGAHVVKCFNTVGFNIMAQPVLEGRKVVMYYCGDDIESKKTVRTLVTDVGFEPVDAGPLSFARMLEPLALVWIASAYKFGLGRDFGFSIVRTK